MEVDVSRTAMITGASSGIGADLARLFARDGYDVVLVARRRERLEKLGAKLAEEHRIEVHILAVDLATPHAARDVVEAVRELGLEIDVLVNNAGFGSSGPFVDADIATVLEMIQVNLVALTELTRLVVESMVERRTGRILNLASTAAFQPGPLMAVYYATKAYVLSFSEAIAEELRQSGVTVTALCPGPTETEFADVAHVESSRLFRMAAPMSSMKVARAGYAALQRGRRVVIPGLRNWMLAQSVRVSPRRVVTTIVRKLQERA